MSYNGDGAVSKIVDGCSGITTEYEYDSLGRLIHAYEYETSTGADLLSVSNRFDAYSRAKESVYAVNDTEIYYESAYNSTSNQLSRFSVYDLDNRGIGYEFTYDSLGRLVTRFSSIGNVSHSESFTYLDKTVGGEIHTSNLINTHTVGGNTYSYTYDSLGNITDVYKNGTLVCDYSYDSLGQLTAAIIEYGTNGLPNAYGYTYDKSGNITCVDRFEGSNCTYIGATNYGYSESAWGDLLTNYNGTTINYEPTGNPINWCNSPVMEWNGRQLSLFAHPRRCRNLLHLQCRRYSYMQIFL